MPGEMLGNTQAGKQGVIWVPGRGQQGALLPALGRDSPSPPLPVQFCAHLSVGIHSSVAPNAMFHGPTATCHCRD